MSKEIWSETRKKLGVTVTMSLQNDGGTLSLRGQGSGFGCSVSFEHPVSSDTKWEGKLNNCGGADVYGAYDIREFRRTPTYVSFELRVWGKVGAGFWVGPEGFKAGGPLAALETAAAVRDYLESGYADDRSEHGFEVSVPAGAPGEPELVPA